MKLLLAACVAVAALALSASASAKPRHARCAISASEGAAYRGPCRFLPGKDGSFSLDPIGRKRFAPDISTISLFVTGPGVAEVSGLTAAGINSRWGEARRSRKDSACWDGADFRICVY